MKKLCIALLLATPLFANAEFYSGNTLLEKINSPNEVVQGVALGYITGVHDALAGITVCAPETITTGQIVKIMKQWFTNNPSLLHHSADRAVLAALKTLWPCAAKTPTAGQLSL
jgi:hypothetical protein